ncbi:hypothetical protein AB5J52_48690 (plasmid) [Streptomyces sp. R39]|uniref:DUF8094 domain-containing protein n=1 Tax=Streptomyces sp. R39 TaxID=3238631 RepID=A0AB39R1Z1_9ACTN
MPRSVHRPSQMRRLSVIPIGVTAAIVLSACSDNGTDHPAAGTSPTVSKAPASRGVITRTAAESVIDHYQATNNRANARRSAQVLGTIETGTLYAQDKADYRLWNTWTKSEQKEYGSPFTYVDRHLWIPPASSGATWFAATVTASTTRAKALIIFDKGSGDTYKAALTLFKGKGESIPAIAVDRNGWAVLADPSKEVGGIAPAGLHAAYEDYWVTGGMKEGTRLAATTKPIKDALQIHRAAEKHGTADGYATKKFFATSPASVKVYALRAADGAVLAAFSTAHTQESLVKPQYRCKTADIVPSKEQAALGAGQGYLITDTFLGQGLASLTSRSARMTNIEWQAVGSRAAQCPKPA